LRDRVTRANRPDSISQRHTGLDTGKFVGVVFDA